MSNHLLKVRLLVNRNKNITETQALYQVLNELSECNKEMDLQLANCLERVNALSASNEMLEEQLSKCIAVMSHKQLHEVGLI